MKIKSLGALLSLSLLLAGCGDAPAGESAPVPPPARIAGNADVPAQALAAPIERLFDAEAERPVGETRALVILHKGQVVAERYGPGFGPESRLHGWSIAKTVTALLVGIMVADGRLALDDPAPVPAWRQPGDPRGAITLRQLLTMSSGLLHSEADVPPERNDGLALLVGPGAADMAGFAAAQPLAAPPGSQFNYSTATTALLAQIVTNRLTTSADPAVRRAAMRDFLRERLIQPLGLTGFAPEFDARGNLVAGAMMHMTAMDFARIGELMRRGGRVDGREVVPERWVRFMRAPSAANPSYGGHVWLNRGTASPLFPGRAPVSLFAAMGHQGQYLIVSPAQQLTIVRLGVSSAEEQDALREAMRALVRLYPRG